MTGRSESITPLRRRMLEDMRLCKLSPTTRTSDIREGSAPPAFDAYCSQ
jgi:hypothetical protein